ncbi:MAG: hypothetical protein JWN03_6558 [Nocardia sp.]|uniref:DUF6636 domain-containing protein n=1 Tax=Nocardia sp. TaxID=1821 RepID=UPI00261B29CF|nr:DUF6636 domain-containing protein [Nocardia sp.]MCU1646283.1 hypothetical protein [Nocardia sp.]
MKATYFSTVLCAVAAATTALALSVAPANAAQLDQFVTPSGNIGCLVGPHGAVCEIRDHSYAQPAVPANCHGAYGDVFSEQDGAFAQINCHTDQPVDFHSRVVDYGQQVRQGTLACNVTTRFVECADGSTGHGFTLAREFYSVY